MFWFRKVGYGCFILCVIAGSFYLFGCKSKDTQRKAIETGENVVIHSQDRARLFKLKKDLQLINRSIQVFHAAHGRYPDSLDELAQKGALGRIPKEPFGGEWNYDPTSGKVTSSSHPEIGDMSHWD